MASKKAWTTCMLFSLLAIAGTALGMNLSSPRTYGKVIITGESSSPAMDAVRFDHWLHRSLFTCRLCHVDIGFAMEANGTSITAEANMKGLYCGTCHNGTRIHGDRKIFSSCTTSMAPADAPRCDRCHSVGKKVRKEYIYEEFSKNLPKHRGGEYIDWEEAEKRGMVKPVDILPGLSVQRPRLEPQKDFAISAKSSWMPNIIFSHKKHAVWNGCEVCHPDIFPSVKKGTVKYTMFEIAEGRYCGLCHTKVAFPISDCEKCHITKVR